jgi:hypothetical protein
MTWLGTTGAKGPVVTVLLAAVAALLVATVFASGVAEAKGGGGGGGRGGGGGGGGKPSSSSSSSKPSSGSSSSAKSGPPARVAEPNSPFYNSPRYGSRHHSFSNFFLWAWIFHGWGREDCDEDDVAEGDPDCYYEEEYIEPNTDLGGWAVMGVGLFGAFFLFRKLRKRSGSLSSHAPMGSPPR